MPAVSPIPDAVAVELERVARRWQQLPLDHALLHAPLLRALTQDLADGIANGAEIIDLGPATAYDQLAVLVYDACVAGQADALHLTDRLATVRRALP
ncbi:hypothetical protein [Demetria terragena]|uniref:hypothetical protein n=1 Tax=Demetria terragena TaxID=63959 RepID=UPI00059102D1|nr:hypothetical protein [Demetria terragena]